MSLSVRVKAILCCALAGSSLAFLPQSTLSERPTTVTALVDGAAVASLTNDLPAIMNSAGSFMESASTMMTAAGTEISQSASALLPSSNLLGFTDQGQNLAGIFFQASLLPYLLFIYFLQFRGNRQTDLTNFGFQYVLVFVLSTIPSGIISKSVYGDSLANTDWLHGGAELLLTTANVLIVLGLTQAMTMVSPPELKKIRNIGLAIAGTFFAFMAAGPSLDFQGHSAFLFGAGNLDTATVASLPWVTHTEPINALSIPTWAIHFSSVIEYVFAMNLVWKFSETTGNEKWKGMTWGMLPLHASGVCACTYHFFYNPSELQFLVTSQAGLTLLGNITCMLAAIRIALSNGWTLSEVNPFKSKTSPAGLRADDLAATSLAVAPAEESTAALAGKLAALTIAASYVTKYGELGLDLPFTPNAPVATAMIVGVPALTAYTFYNRGVQETGEGFKLPSFGNGDGEGLSMADVKKFGVSGTVAYVLTELAFWIVAFPAAAYALYNTSGHWPDVINDTTDRAAVLGFIFAGANIARAFVPIRLGAALALAPWVDENIINRGGDEAETTE